MPRLNVARAALVAALALLPLAAAPTLAASAAPSYAAPTVSRSEMGVGGAFTLSGQGCVNADAPWNTPFVGVIGGAFSGSTRAEDDGSWTIQVNLGRNVPPGRYAVEADCQMSSGDDGRYPHVVVTLLGHGTFTDVPTRAPFARDIEWLSAADIATGGSDDTFRPNARVTRQAMASFLYHYAHPGTPRIGGGPAPSPDPPRCAWRAFRDVPASSLYCGSIAWLAREDITSGTSSGRFAPLGTVTRQQMAVFLYALEHGGATPPPCGSAPFRDVPASSAYCGSISWLATTGLTSSSASSNFDPTGAVTRGMMAAFLHRLASG